jgi:hypothetical protein
MLGGLGLGLAWWMGSLCYETIASLEGIHDARSSQVTTLFGCWLGAFWIVGLVANARGHREPSTAASFVKAVMSSRSRWFVGAIAGVCITTLVTSAALVATASLSILVVTPPAAWLIMTPATGLGGLFGVRALDRSSPPTVE